MPLLTEILKISREYVKRLHFRDSANINEFSTKQPTNYVNFVQNII